VLASAWAWATSGSASITAASTIRSSRYGVTVAAIAHTRASTRSAAAWLSAWVAWAIRRARHACTCPASTRAQVRGSRCRNANASSINPVAALVDIPSAAPSSAGANSATSGQPSPPHMNTSSIPGKITTPGAPAGRGGAQMGVVRGHLEQAGLGSVGCGAQVCGHGQRRVRIQPSHITIEHVYDSTEPHRHFSDPETLVDKGNRHARWP
jgi:hypothetical protein